jgi:predicted nucleotidyltransferase
LQGIKAAQKAANLLKQELGAKRVVRFGSVLRAGFHKSSDLDLAVWGLPESCYFNAIARLDGFTIDLVEIQSALPHIVDAIADGMEL